MSSSRPEVLVVGGGLVGLSIADCSVRLGLSVEILERERAGARASWAGAGMLMCRPWPKPPEGESDYHDLVFESIKLHEAWAARLLEETGIDVGFVRCGALELIGLDRVSPAGDDNIRRLLDGCAQRGIPAERITPAQARALEPKADLSGYGDALHFPSDAQVRNNRLGRALAVSCRQQGVQIREGQNISDLWMEGGRVRGILTQDGGRIEASQVVLAAGAWTPQFPSLVKAMPRAARIEPVRGQILCYRAPQVLCRRLLTTGHLYLVPRPDGVILAGSTMERVGFSTVTTPEGQAALKAFAESLLPDLKGLEPLMGWADVRPGLKGPHPLVGPVPGVDGLFVAAGHYRSGITLASITGTIVAELLAGRPAPAMAEPLLPKAKSQSLR
jgi:glycine oxidase